MEPASGTLMQAPGGDKRGGGHHIRAVDRAFDPNWPSSEGFCVLNMAFAALLTITSGPHRRPAAQM